MNFAITGKKIVSSPQPEKKLTQVPNNKPKVQQKPTQVKKPTLRKPSLPVTNKIQATKIQTKKQEVKKEPLNEVLLEEKKQPKIQQPPKLQIEQVPKVQEPPKQPPKISEILVRYNHYKEKFPTQNNVLKYQVIEDKYNFASVFKGNFQPKLQIYRNYGKFIEPLTSGTALQYTWQIEEGKQYEITIEQDEQEESKYERKVYIAPKQEPKCSLKKNQKVTELTQQMRQMAVQQLGSEKHRELLQQRALQEILFS